jgi:carbamoyl-phosphate synthase large subunit
MLIPTLDAEILTLINARGHFEERGIKIVLPTLESFLARGKDQLDELVKGTGARVPKTVAVSSTDALVAAAEGLRYPVMVKGCSYDALKVDSSSRLASAFCSIMDMWGGPVIVQEFIRGEEFNIAVVGDGAGGVEGSCSIRKSVRSEKGKGFGGIVIDDPVLTATGQRLIEKLKWNGPCELEFVQDAADGSFYLIEINPRFPAWIDFPSSFDYNLPKLVVDRMSAAVSAALPSRCPTGHFFLRHATDILGRIDELGQLTARGELLNRRAFAADNHDLRGIPQ